MCISHRNIIQPVIEKFLLNDMKMKDIHVFSSMFSLRVGNSKKNSPQISEFCSNLFSFQDGKQQLMLFYNLQGKQIKISKIKITTDTPGNIRIRNVCDDFFCFLNQVILYLWNCWK